MKFTKLQIVTHLGAWVPLAWLIFDYATNNLTVNPIQDLTFRTGKPALALLVLSLACTPLQIFGWREPLKVRRALGLYAFLYASLHFLIFIGVDYGFNFGFILSDVGQKRFVLVGFAAFLILLALAVTSFDWWKKRLRKNWKRLHRAVYVAGLLAVVHYIWLVKSDIREPLLWGAVVIVLLLIRLPAVRRWLKK